MILDDGFQNPRLAPDVALLVVDGSYGFGNGRLLPAGPLREPIADGLRRATAVIRIGADRAGIDRLLPADLPCLAAELRPAPAAPALVGRRLLAFAGIARPEKLFTTLSAAGAELVGCEAFADHHRYRRAEIERLLARAAREEALCITTSKDAVRLPADLRARVAVLPIALSVAAAGSPRPPARPGVAVTPRSRCDEAFANLPVSKLLLTCAFGGTAGT